MAGGLGALAFLALCKVGFCVGVLCALQCAKNSVGSGRQSHGWLNLCRVFNRVTYNGAGIAEGDIRLFKISWTSVAFGNALLTDVAPAEHDLSRCIGRNNFFN